MQKSRMALCALLVMLAGAQVPAQDKGDAAPADAGAAGFSLIPLLEAAFSGEIPWRPDWPEDFPPDAFLLSAETQRGAAGKKLSIVVSLGGETYAFTRARSGRLLEFPFFSQSGALQVAAVWNGAGGLQTLNVSAAAVWTFTFPADFLLFDSDAAGADFPPIRASSPEGDFFVFIRASPAWLTETWYDADGNIACFFRADLLPVYGRRSRVASLQTRNADGLYTETYHFDSGGNVSEIRGNDLGSSPDVFSAQYQNNMPRYWNREPEVQYALQWDARGLLVGKRAAEGAEFRYEYELDKTGNWIKRQDIAITGQLGVPPGVFAPQPGAAWTRVIRLGD